MIPRKSVIPKNRLPVIPELIVTHLQFEKAMSMRNFPDEERIQ